MRGKSHSQGLHSSMDVDSHAAYASTSCSLRCTFRNNP